MDLPFVIPKLVKALVPERTLRSSVCPLSLNYKVQRLDGLVPKIVSTVLPVRQDRRRTYSPFQSGLGGNVEGGLSFPGRDLRVDSPVALARTILLRLSLCVLYGRVFEIHSWS